jgi:cholesterol transport system auxiliary component
MIARIRSVLALSVTLVLLSGCTLLPERPTKSTFMLTNPDLSPKEQPPLPLTLRVLTPQAESPHNGTSVLVNPEGEIIQAYGGARWVKPVPVLIRDHWVEGLRQSGILKAVVSETSDARSDLSLASDLTRFQLRYDQGEPIIVIQLDAQLLESNSRQVLASKRFEVIHSVVDKPVESVIAGFGAASQIATEDLVAWLGSVSLGFHAGKDPARPPSDTESSTRK